MADLTRETLAEIRRLREAATPGEWVPGFTCSSVGTEYLGYAHQIKKGIHEYTVAHTTHKRQTVEWDPIPDQPGYVRSRQVADHGPFTGPVHPDAALIALAINNLDALLAAAERGLDAEGGR